MNGDDPFEDIVHYEVSQFMIANGTWRWYAHAYKGNTILGTAGVGSEPAEALKELLDALS